MMLKYEKVKGLVARDKRPDIIDGKCYSNGRFYTEGVHNQVLRALQCNVKSASKEYEETGRLKGCVTRDSKYPDTLVNRGVSDRLEYMQYICGALIDREIRMSKYEVECHRYWLLMARHGAWNGRG